MDGPKISELVSQYRGHKISTKDIARKFKISDLFVKKRLVSHLGKKQYMKIAHSIGGCTVARKLRTHPKLLRKHSIKMSEKVSLRIQKLMENQKFSAEWKKKAEAGSKKGIRKLKRLMKDPVFQSEWKQKCSTGGKNAYLASTGIYARKNATARRQWSLTGLKRTGRKVIGPNGEKMYNALEKRVATTLEALNIPYTYEKRFDTDTLNGFFSIDFQICGNVFIEATYWDKAMTKSKILNKKYEMLNKLFHKRLKFIVVTRQNQTEEYRKYLERDIKVCCPKELTTLLATIAR